MTGISIFLDVVLLAALSATLYFARQLQLQISTLRENYEALPRIAEAMRFHTQQAQTHLEVFKNTVAPLEADLSGRIREARVLADDMKALNFHGERLAQRLEAAVLTTPTPAANNTRKTRGRKAVEAGPDLAASSNAGAMDPRWMLSTEDEQEPETKSVLDDVTATTPKRKDAAAAAREQLFQALQGVR